MAASDDPPVVQAEALARQVADLAATVQVLTARCAALEAQADHVRGQLRAMEERLLRRIDGLHNTVGPGEDLLALPLVFRSEEGEYLGVSDKAQKHFSLRDFLALVSDNGGSRRSLALAWQRPDPHAWQLTIRELPGLHRRERRHHLTLRQQTTPRGNTVACIEDLRVAGRPMPVFFLYELFRQIGRGFA